MLPLDSPRWGELRQAYGSAEDVPRLLAHLDRVSDAERRELWFGLWSTLWRQGDVYTASYAAVPHLVAFAETQPAAERARALHLAATIEVGRQAPGSDALPQELAPSYFGALARIAPAVAACVGEPWDGDTAQALAGALAIAKGQPHLGNAVLSLEPVTSCPACEATFPTAGWEVE